MNINLKTIGTAFAGTIIYYVFFDSIQNILSSYVGDGVASIGIILIPFIFFGVIILSIFTGNDGRGYKFDF